MRALITGGTGFVGVHLANHLLACRDDVIVTYFAEDLAGGSNSAEANDVSDKFAAAKKEKFNESRIASLKPQVQKINLDVCDSERVKGVLQVMQPDVVYHLAGVSFVPQAEGLERGLYEANTMGLYNVLSAAAEVCPGSRVLFVSSSASYGVPRGGLLPFVENSELRPYSAYGASKAAAEMIAMSYALRGDLGVVIARSFAHTGPYHDDRFSLSSFAKQLAAMKLGRQAPLLRVGSLNVKRDFSDVADIVRGYREASLNGKNGEVYNFCSGQSYELQDLVHMLVQISGLDVSIEVDEDRVRPIDVPDHYGSYEKALRDFGWKPRVDIKATLSGLYTFWLEYLADSPDST